MRTAFVLTISLIIYLSALNCNSQIASNALSVGGDFGKNWISSFKTQNPQTAEQKSQKNDLWSWGSSP